MGSFRPSAGIRHFHRHYNFTEILVETAPTGRNLPDKEFRYLRTVIVTADIHGGFGSELRVSPDPLP